MAAGLANKDWRELTSTEKGILNREVEEIRERMRQQENLEDL